jgi:hypothetical protein
MSPAGTERKFQENYVDHHSFTYRISNVALKNAGVDLDICTLGIDCATLLVVACPPPGIGTKI